MPASLTIAREDATVRDATGLLPIRGRAFTLLLALAEQAGAVVSVRQLMDRVWPDRRVDEANLRSNITALRRILGDAVLNVPGRGYMLAAPVRIADDSVPVSGAPPLARMPSHLFGRSKDMRSLGSLIRRNRLVTVTGPAGVGKSVLARAALRRLRSRTRITIDLASLATGGAPMPALASALGLAHTGSYGPIVDRLRLANGPLLLLDNCDHATGPIAALAHALLGDMADLAIVTTGRQPLRAPGETLYPVAPLPVPDPDAQADAADWRYAPAIRLFLDCFAASGGGGAIADADLPCVIEICRKLDGLPLAIELAADRAAAHGLSPLVGLLDDRFAILSRGRRTAPPRHRTLRAAIEWSYDLLSADERAVFCRLAGLPPAFDLAAVAQAGVKAPAGTTLLALLESLVAQSFLVSDAKSGGRTYRLLETMHALAREKGLQASTGDTPWDWQLPAEARAAE